MDTQSEQIFDPTFFNLEYGFLKIIELFQKIYEYFISDTFAFILIILTVIIVALLIYVIVYSSIKLREIRQQEKKELESLLVVEPTSIIRNKRWERVVEHAQTENPSEWRLAIIEADAILDEMMKKMQYDGANLGERLKQVEKSDFWTLDLAWEAHKIRNRIAHEGAEFNLTKREARRVMGLYEEVFREFDYI